MAATVWLVIFLVVAVLLLLQLGVALGWTRGLATGLGACLLLGGTWLVITWTGHPTSATGQARTQGSAPSTTCFKCHEEHYASWHQTYHRTMTREATPEYVKGDFNNVTYLYHGIPTRLTREGDTFHMETLDPAWARQTVQHDRDPDRDAAPATPPSPRLRKFKVERLVGSHWFQECMYKDDTGRYWRLPVSYHLVEKRWIHTNGAFLAPDTEDFWSKSTVWNDSCVFCHNTKPSKNPLRLPGDRRGVIGYETEVAELGIACEACHGPGQHHARVNQNPARRFALQQTGTGDPTITNPKRLSIQRSDDICAHCHGALAPRSQSWNPVTLTDPFNAGEALTQSYHFFWSEIEQEVLYGKRPAPDQPPRPGPLDGRFWGDGTPMTTAVEYQGMALSACYERGHGKLSCLSCHSMHQSDPNFLLARRMETNEACYQCHESFRGRLAEHTYHPTDSPGSLCYNCHMPYQVYSLLTTHRSHRIEGLRIKDSLGTGKPHACNLCHLDKSLGWTQDRLVEWYHRTPEPLSAEDQKYASTLVHLTQSDARTRAVVAGAFSWPAAHQASGTNWAGPFLVRILEQERYPAVRYLVYRGLRSLYGNEIGAYDYQAGLATRRTQLKALRSWLASRTRPAARSYPYLPLSPDGEVLDSVLNALLQKRNDPDVFIHE
jgi:predicted CXXCH cytochrome family protein